jgi:adenosylhomocysteine nucleosidase
LNGLGIVAAFAAESRHLGPAMPRSGGRSKGPGEALATLADGTLLVVSGMGGAAASRGARQLVDAGAKALLSWGMAGGLDPALPAGALFLPGEVISADGAIYQTAREWREALAARVAPCDPVTGGRLLTSRQAIASAAAKAIAFRETGASAVDMESAAIAEVARAQGLPFLAVRAIVDTAEDPLPKPAITAAGESTVRLSRLLAALARAPQDLPALIRLMRRYRAASRSLAAVARAGALAPRELRAAAPAARP